MYPYDNFNYGNVPPFGTPQYGYNAQPYQQRANQQPQTNTNKIYVSGLEDVKTRNLPANSDYIFLDNDKPILYQKIVSPNGQFEVKTFTISPYSPEEKELSEKPMDLSGYVKTKDLEALKAEINELKTKLFPKKVEVANGNNGTKQV